MYILERLVFQGTEKCPQYLWTQMLMSKNRDVLEAIHARQPHPENWRVCPTSEDVSSYLERTRENT